MRKNIIREKSFVFALGVVQLYKYIVKEHHEFVLSKQLLRSGTSVGAMVREAEHAESKYDFVHKMAIAQKEINECRYWLDLLHQSKYITDSHYNSVYSDSADIIKLVTTIIKSTKANLQVR